MKIYIENSFCRIKPDHESEKYLIEALKEKLSYSISTFNFDYKLKKRIFKNETVSLLDLRNGKFSSGLLSNVCGYLKSQNINLTLTDLRKKPEISSIFRLYQNLPPLRPYQEDCINLVGKIEKGTISLPTGLGKTILAVGMIHKLGQTTLFIVPSLNLLNQTKEVFEIFFGKKNVGTLKDSDQKKPIIVGNYQSLVKKPESFFARFNLLIVDEAHHSACDSFISMNNSKWNSIYYRYFLSGTPYRNDGTDLKLTSIIGDIIYHYPLAQAVKDGWICPPSFYIFQIENFTKGTPFSFNQEYKDLIVYNLKRNLKIKNISNRLVDKGLQVLILVKEIAHGENLMKLIPYAKFIQGETSKDKVAENTNTLKDFDKKRFPLLIATSVIGEGTDIKSLDCIINAAGYKAKSEVIQKVGRALRLLEGKKEAVVVDFYDVGGKWVENHSNERIRHYRDYETKISFKEDI